MKSVVLDPRRAEKLEQNAKMFADQLRQAMVTVRNWSSVGGPDGKALRNDWGIFAYTRVEQPQAINPHVDMVKRWEPHHYLLQGVLMKTGDVDAVHDFPILLRRVAHFLGAVNPLEMRNGTVVETPAGERVIASRPLLITPASQRPDEVITLRWQAPPRA